MASADLVLYGTILTVNAAQPAAEAIAVADGRIVAVGSRSEVAGWVGEHTDVREVDGCVMPGFVEAHGHPLMEAVALSDRIVDIRPVTLPSADAVLDAIGAEVTRCGADGAFLNGWDPLLQIGLPEPTLTWLDGMAPETPLVIVHNSGHKAFFNTAAARRNGLTKDTPDPKGAKYGRDADGELDGTAEEIAAVYPLLGNAISASDYPAMLAAECARLNRAGLTTCSEMSFDPMFRPLLAQQHDQLTVRLRTYEMSTAALHTDAAPFDGDDMVRQVGIKIWVDGSPWVGNIDLTFPYLDTDATRTIGVVPGSCGHANYTREQLAEIVGTFYPQGWQLACHVHGDAGVDTILDVYEQALRAHPREDHRLRLEHCGAITPEQLQRAHDLGVTCSLFVDHLHYWGDVLVDGLFGPERGGRWMPAGSAVATGMRISLHNDPPVTPEEPLRNISVAVTRTAPSGRVLAPEERLTVEQAIRAQTIDAAWQLFADNVIGSLEVGKYADLVIVSADPRATAPQSIADLDVQATFLAGRQVYPKTD
ncbi:MULTISPECIES: amidohydrolase [unclassified Mycolicibacterium]|uniref:amidohydrolase n=1 Tax=unclassified Mycolicibacterium TaxID=2636767 RepID=UPI00130BFEAC|nr:MULTISPECIES: amidohydrolase [unclassified Mycolicibacterium]MUL81633.1 amidohydrolase [Mycolicibacterium sp. CBMA 329]MUL87399.1 amidohydrolase [Mycolicibacterium sp. CBMA 331]MUL99735.1 amidohydrolase [Mycolicibacterium sp. CBMA 334]MUM25355.1 amidohydrolase [Mycolicibacterium sp. CBMA 295]MUM37696.1 amidohydrolase [Mycolicibacterium sp. CBMA 247]